MMARFIHIDWNDLLNVNTIQRIKFLTDKEAIEITLTTGVTLVYTDKSLERLFESNDIKADNGPNKKNNYTEKSVKLFNLVKRASVQY